MRKVIRAAAEDEFDFDRNPLDEEIEDDAEEIEEDEEELEDEDLELYDEDEPEIEVDNNITNHCIAECDECHGVFISAVTWVDDLEIESINGICPLCNKETEQTLKWVIKDIDEIKNDNELNI